MWLGQFYKQLDFGSVEIRSLSMKFYLRSFRCLLLCQLFFNHELTAQREIDISLTLLAAPTPRSFYQTDSIILEAEQNNLLISFGPPSKNAQKYFCELWDGVARDTFTSSNQLVLKNLTGGVYQLKVVDTESKAMSTLRFTIKPVLWQQLWFLPLIYFIAFLLVSSIIYLFAMYRFRQQFRLQHIRNEIAADLHDDVGSTLSNISFLGEMAKMKFEKRPEDVLPLLERIIENSKEMVQTMRGMVWTINPDNDNAYDFIDKVRAFATEMLQNREIILNFKNEIPQNQLLTIEQQRNLFLIFKELIHNIAKHSAATQVTIHLKKHDSWLWAKVTDDGRGFDTSQVPDGNGLRNLQHRVAQLEGKMDVTSTIGSGTSTKLMIPL